jgi:hypothetical protein
MSSGAGRRADGHGSACPYYADDVRATIGAAEILTVALGILIK